MSKIVLITGTNSGFGKLATKSLSDKGHKVYAGMRNVSSSNAEAAQEMATWPNVEVVELDVTNSDSAQKTVAEIIAKEGKLDVLVNNAGVFTSGIAETYTDEDLEKILDVNVKGPWRMIRNTLPQFKTQGEGLIINISSGLGRFSAPFMTIYNSSKFALEGLVEGSHYELRGLGIENVLIQPGAFPSTGLAPKTMMGSDMSAAEGYGDLVNIPMQMGQALHQMVENGTAPDPQLVADAIVNLVEGDKGSRPLRTVVDPMTGTFTETANKAVLEEYRKFLGAFHMDVLMN